MGDIAFAFPSRRLAPLIERCRRQLSPLCRRVQRSARPVSKEERKREDRQRDRRHRKIQRRVRALLGEQVMLSFGPGSIEETELERVEENGRTMSGDSLPGWSSSAGVVITGVERRRRMARWWLKRGVPEPEAGEESDSCDGGVSTGGDPMVGGRAVSGRNSILVDESGTGMSLLSSEFFPSIQLIDTEKRVDAGECHANEWACVLHTAETPQLFQHMVSNGISFRWSSMNIQSESLSKVSEEEQGSRTSLPPPPYSPPGFKVEGFTFLQRWCLSSSVWRVPPPGVLRSEQLESHNLVEDEKALSKTARKQRRWEAESRERNQKNFPIPAPPADIVRMASYRITEVLPLWSWLGGHVASRSEEKTEGEGTQSLVPSLERHIGIYPAGLAEAVGFERLQTALWRDRARTTRPFIEAWDEGEDPLSHRRLLALRLLPLPFHPYVESSRAKRLRHVTLLHRSQVDPGKSNRSTESEDSIEDNVVAPSVALAFIAPDNHHGAKGRRRDKSSRGFDFQTSYSYSGGCFLEVRATFHCASLPDLQDEEVEKEFQMSISGRRGGESPNEDMAAKRAADLMRGIDSWRRRGELRPELLQGMLNDAGLRVIQEAPRLDMISYVSNLRQPPAAFGQSISASTPTPRSVLPNSPSHGAAAGDQPPSYDSLWSDVRMFRFLSSSLLHPNVVSTSISGSNSCLTKRNIFGDRLVKPDEECRQLDALRLRETGETKLRESSSIHVRGTSSHIFGYTSSSSSVDENELDSSSEFTEDAPPARVISCAESTNLIRLDTLGLYAKVCRHDLQSPAGGEEGACREASLETAPKLHKNPEEAVLSITTLVRVSPDLAAYALASDEPAPSILMEVEEGWVAETAMRRLFPESFVFSEGLQSLAVRYMYWENPADKEFSDSDSDHDNNVNEEDAEGNAALKVAHGQEEGVTGEWFQVPFKVTPPPPPCVETIIRPTHRPPRIVHQRASSSLLRPPLCPKPKQQVASNENPSPAAPAAAAAGHDTKPPSGDAKPPLDVEGPCTTHPHTWKVSLLRETHAFTCSTIRIRYGLVRRCIRLGDCRKFCCEDTLREAALELLYPPSSLSGGRSSANASVRKQWKLFQQIHRLLLNYYSDKVRLLFSYVNQEVVRNSHLYAEDERLVGSFYDSGEWFRLRVVPVLLEAERSLRRCVFTDRSIGIHRATKTALFRWGKDESATCESLEAVLETEHTQSLTCEEAAVSQRTPNAGRVASVETVLPALIAARQPDFKEPQHGAKRGKGGESTPLQFPVLSLIGVAAAGTRISENQKEGEEVLTSLPCEPNASIFVPSELQALRDALSPTLRSLEALEASIKKEMNWVNAVYSGVVHGFWGPIVRQPLTAMIIELQKDYWDAYEKFEAQRSALLASSSPGKEQEDVDSEEPETVVESHEEPAKSMTEETPLRTPSHSPQVSAETSLDENALPAVSHLHPMEVGEAGRTSGSQSGTETGSKGVESFTKSSKRSGKGGKGKTKPALTPSKAASTPNQPASTPSKHLRKATREQPQKEEVQQAPVLREAWALILANRAVVNRCIVALTFVLWAMSVLFALRTYVMNS